MANDLNKICLDYIALGKDQLKSQNEMIRLQEIVKKLNDDVTKLKTVVRKLEEELQDAKIEIIELRKLKGKVAV